MKYLLDAIVLPLLNLQEFQGQQHTLDPNAEMWKNIKTKIINVYIII